MLVLITIIVVLTIISTERSAIYNFSPCKFWAILITLGTFFLMGTLIQKTEFIFRIYK